MNKKIFKISALGITLIKKYEEFRNNPYLCPVGKPTIGWGNTFYEDGTLVTLNDPPITRKRGDELFLNIVAIFEDKVNKNVTSNINQNQFDALVCFAYNQKKGAFESSTLLKRINANPEDEDIKYQFSRWNKGTVNGKLVELKGLTKRRNEEAFLYFVKSIGIVSS